MRNLNLLLFCILFTVLFSNCSIGGEPDWEEIVEMTIYPETRCGGSVMSEI
ncbi:hypothetical protein [uncultured Salegentibacter sp.]|uniref:hypothetical protein n=1 Tax=uncultured Salegentibacter sp. TaxID=259320 RepID=UPI002595ABEF|nr:hypothetical protein [uncultured Salegentibacter sp.]